MKHLRITTEPTALDTAIDEALAQLTHHAADSEEYAAITNQVVRLMKLKEKPSHSRVDRNTMAMIAGNLAGIGMILSYERTHVITSKALGFVLRSVK